MIPSRERALILLLETSELYYGASLHGKVWGGYTRAESGPAPSSKQPCPGCDGGGRTIPSGRPCVACRNGQPQGSHPCVPCADCAGKGWRFVDDYTGAPVAHVERPRVKVASSGARARSHAPVAEGLEVDAGRWETACEKADRTGSYRALRAAMQRLAEQDPNAYRMVLSVHVHGNGRERTQRERRRLQRGMVRLDQMMPRTLRLPQWLQERLAGEQRAGDARALRDGGASLRQIQADLGVRKRRLKRMLAD
jgi:hypothetical protein